MVGQYADWIDYWSRDDFWKDSPLWRINAKNFFECAKGFIEFKKDDCVLDIGCGAGYTEALLAPLVKSVYALDVAPQFVEVCSKRCQGLDNVRVGYLNKDAYTNLEGCPGKFSVILCVSVVQYYNSLAEVEALILSAKKLAAAGAKMLIADLPLARGRIGFIWDAFCSFGLSIRKGYTKTLLSSATARWFGRTDYKVFHDQAKQLYFSADKLKSIINRLGLNARIIKGNFSVYANRLSLLIQF